jgi:uncharacterized protein (TIGR02246 family)
MNNKLSLLALTLLTPGFLVAQGTLPTDRQRQEIHALIDAYSEARAKQDTALMESILTADIDQLVSSGEWRRGKAASMQGMGRSSASNPGTRTLKVENVRLLNPQVGIVDARYDIQAPNGATRNMWSTFVVVHVDGSWKISAIRNMLPTSQQ